MIFRVKTRLLLLLLCLGAAPLAMAETRYVTDQFEIPLRAGESLKYKVLRNLPSGTPLEVLSSNAKSGYSKVRTLDGRTGFVLTFSTREQHIRREKATSNICSNHALNALAAGVYLSAVGREGLAGIGEACVARAHYLESALVGTGRFERVFDAPFAHEFTLRYAGDVPAMQTQLLARGFLAGLDLGRFSAADEGLVLFAVTEKRTRAELDRFVSEVSAL